MKNFIEKSLAVISIMLGIAFLVVACGEYKGQGSNDSKIGAVVKVSEIIPKDRGEPNQSNGIDMRLSPCEMDGATVTAWEDPLTEATMEVTFYNDDKTPVCEDTECPDVYILSYKVEFESDDSYAPELSPIQRDIYYFLEAGDELTVDNLLLMPWSTKNQFVKSYNASNSWGQIANYTVKVTFKGEDEFGQEFEFKAQTYVGCGDWLVCD